jgi:hypothetical protein
MPAFSPKFPRSLLRTASWFSPAALQLQYLSRFNCWKARRRATMVRMVWFRGIAGLIFRRTIFLLTARLAEIISAQSFAVLMPKKNMGAGMRFGIIGGSRFFHH